MPCTYDLAVPPSALSCSGIGGNLVSIQSSRISTNLHLNYSPGEVPEDSKSCYNPCGTFFGSGKDQSVEILKKNIIPVLIPVLLVPLHASHVSWFVVLIQFWVFLVLYFLQSLPWFFFAFQLFLSFSSPFVSLTCCAGVFVLGSFLLKPCTLTITT